MIDTDINTRIIELLESDIETQRGLGILREEFSWMNDSNLISTWRRVKKQWCTAKYDDYLAVPYVGVDRSKKEIERLGNKDMATKKTVPPKLEVISKEIKVRGEYGLYVVNNNGVKAGELIFKTLEEVNKYEEEELAIFSKKIEELKTVFKVF